MNAVRSAARDLRLRIERDEKLGSLEECAAACVSLDDALTAFDGHSITQSDGVYPTCCRRICTTSGGWLGMWSRCEVCGAEIRDALGPMSSPFLRRGNAFVMVPGEKMVELFGEKNWFVAHEGDRP